MMTTRKLAKATENKSVNKLAMGCMTIVVIFLIALHMLATHLLDLI
jgi:hypothetical protein